MLEQVVSRMKRKGANLDLQSLKLKKLERVFRYLDSAMVRESLLKDLERTFVGNEAQVPHSAIENAANEGMIRLALFLERELTDPELDHLVHTHSSHVWFGMRHKLREASDGLYFLLKDQVANIVQTYIAPPDGESEEA